MNAVLNHTAIPFFDRVPSRGKEAVISVFDHIVERSWTLKEAYTFFNSTLRGRGIVGPTWPEFEDWYARVKNGLIERPHPSEAIVAITPYHPTIKTVIEREIVKQPLVIACHAASQAADYDSLKQARGIVEAAHHLFEAKIAAGHSPLSVSIEDTIVAEALRELLQADGEGLFADATSNALDSALSFLQRGTDEQQDKLLDLLTMDMQQELCRELVKRPPPQPR
ncbi:MULTISPECIES: hypothetical protein [unclassified Rhizobium]|uniref:hypothetical protein n=1 Tax=unclassified Rhizobium TaxID=2613769 RepID=UPI00177E3042|nr:MULTISPECIES: hypothetical protein [unclassified Rhizobium]MBD8686605.1 hypothetical protein [Rhizobium sp. CFBP 13644]MBD8691593.1 hypothetical protein [Rhizobium sp. CFBP 13717]